MASVLAPIPAGQNCHMPSHESNGACIICCIYCDADMHECPHCGAKITHNGKDPDTLAWHTCLAHVD